MIIKDFTDVNFNADEYYSHAHSDKTVSHSMSSKLEGNFIEITDTRALSRVVCHHINDDLYSNSSLTVTNACSINNIETLSSVFINTEHNSINIDISFTDMSTGGGINIAPINLNIPLDEIIDAIQERIYNKTIEEITDAE